MYYTPSKVRPKFAELSSMNVVYSLSSQQLNEHPDEWTSFVFSHPAAHFLQLREWGLFKEQFGWTSSIITTGNTRHPIGIAGTEPDIKSGTQILYRTFGPPQISSLATLAAFKLAYIPKGPLVDWQNSAEVEMLLSHVEADCRRRGAGILKIEPDLPDLPANRALLAKFGFRPSSQTVQPRSTILLDISDDEEQILARMKSKWRYNIRLAKRKGVTIRTITEADLPAFHALMQVTGQRNGFFVHEPAYYEAAYHTFVPEFATFLLAEYQGEPLAAVVIMALGNRAWYPWGASSNRERNRMPNYALHWAAIRWAKSRGATLYDLWGIPDSIGEMGMSMTQASEGGIPTADVPIDLNNLPQGELWGVYRLKQGFGGNVFRTVGAWDKPLRPLSFQLYQAGLKVRKELPALRRKLTMLWHGASSKQTAAEVARGTE